MKRCLILTGGKLSLAFAGSFLKEHKFEKVVAVDGGLEAAKEAVRGLKSAAGYMRRELGQALHLRHVPELRFVADSSIEYSVNIYKKLEELEKQEKEGGGHEA